MGAGLDGIIVDDLECCVEETVCPAAGVIPPEGSKLLVGRYR